MKSKNLKSRKWLWGLPLLLMIALIVLFSFEQSRTFLIALIIRAVFFVKHHIVAILTAFFLVNGKFILSLFLKKIAILSATGLGKRYFIEKVITHNVKIHFLDHIKEDLLRLIHYIKNNFRKFPIVKQFIAIIAFMSSLGFVTKFMGWMLAAKVFVAKFWSFLLAIVLKTGTAIVYFFTDYVWGTWVAPIVEVVIFSWLLQWLERVPFLKRFFAKLYRILAEVFETFEEIMEKVFHIPMKQFFARLTKFVKKLIHQFIEQRRVSSWYSLKQLRAIRSNSHQSLIIKRYERKRRKQKKKTYVRIYDRVLEQRTGYSRP